MRFFRAAIAFLAVFPGAAFAEPALKQLWKSEAVLEVPESVCLDTAKKRLFVTNTGGREPWAKDGNGSISLLSPDGTILERKWAKDLDGPKGMAIVDELLVVADIDVLVLLRSTDATVVRRIAVPGAKMLNDVAKGPGRSVFVSDSANGIIHRVDLGTDAVTVAIRDLEQVNGVLHSEGILWFLDKGALCKPGPDGRKVVVARGLKGGSDGIERVNSNSFLVSGWQGFVDLVGTDGSVKRLLETRSGGKNAADIGYDAEKMIVYIPTFFANSVEAWQLSE
jgi:hypothetical protein